MKLVYRILMHISWALSLLLAGWAVLFCFTLTNEINDEVDESLENRAEMLIARTLAGQGSDANAADGSSHYLHEVSPEYAASRPHEVYTDEEVFFPERDDDEEARVLRTIFRDRDGVWRELTVMIPTIEKDDLQEAVLWSVAGLYLLLLLTILAVNVLVLHRTLRPLYALLRWLDAYTVGGKNAPLADDTDITEFRRLNEAACRYAARAESLFERQKQFIGNASHEMQTPLAVCRNRLEMLVDDAPAMSEEQLGEIMKVQRTLDYLVRLNKSLLLLSKIDNGQFPETERVDVGALVRRVSEDFREIYASRGMRFELRERAALTAAMNPSLATSLVSNLVKNAFVHSEPGSEIVVEVEERMLRVCNTAAAGPLDGAHIFDRFYQGTKKEGSTGLGLSIVDAVGRLYGLDVSYAYAGERHCFTVVFP